MYLGNVFYLKVLLNNPFNISFVYHELHKNNKTNLEVTGCRLSGFVNVETRRKFAEHQAI